MSIKPLHLMQKALTLSDAKPEIADGAFRSLQDVQDHLEGIQTKLKDLDGLVRQYQLQFARVQTRAASDTLVFDVDVTAPKGPRKPRGGKTIDMDKIDKIVVPKIEVLRKNFSLVDELSDQVDELDKVYNNVAVTFRGVRGSAEMLKAIKTTQKTATLSLDKALKFLGDIGEKHTPKQFKDLVRETITYVSPELDFKAHKTYIYGYETKEGNLAFAVYLELTDLTDDENNVYPKFFIVFNCILKPTKDDTKVEPSYYLTVMHDFATPGKYSLGKRITSSEQASSALGTMLELENINTGIGTVPHNLDPDKVNKKQFKARNKIASIEVAPNSLSFLLVKGVKGETLKDVAGSLYTDVKAMWSHIKKATVSMKIVPEANTYVVKFTLTTMAKDNQISVNDIDFLKEQFGLDDSKLRKVIQVINEESEA